MKQNLQGSETFPIFVLAPEGPFLTQFFQHYGFEQLSIPAVYRCYKILQKALIDEIRKRVFGLSYLFPYFLRRSHI